MFANKYAFIKTKIVPKNFRYFFNKILVNFVEGKCFSNIG